MPAAQRLELLTAAPKDKRVAAFEPDHTLAGTCFADHQPFDESLWCAGATAALANVDQTRPSAQTAQRLVQHAIADQVINQQQRGLADRAPGPDRQQVGVARAGADEPDAAGGLGRCLAGRPHAMRSWTG